MLRISQLVNDYSGSPGANEASLGVRKRECQTGALRGLICKQEAGYIHVEFRAEDINLQVNKDGFTFIEPNEATYTMNVNRKEV